MGSGRGKKPMPGSGGLSLELGGNEYRYTGGGRNRYLSYEENEKALAADAQRMAFEQMMGREARSGAFAKSKSRLAKERAELNPLGDYTDSLIQALLTATTPRVGVTRDSTFRTLLG